MRYGSWLALAALAPLSILAGCPSSTQGDDDGFENCQDNDANCDSGNICARDGECVPPDDVRQVVVAWTVDGQPASDTTCAQFPDLELDFSSSFEQGGVGFLPVPCNEGRFLIDKMPVFYDTVQAEPDPDTSAVPVSAMFDANGSAQLDLTGFGSN